MNDIILGMVKLSLDRERSKLNHLLSEIRDLEGKVSRDFTGDLSPEVSYLKMQLDLLKKRSTEIEGVLNSGERFLQGITSLSGLGGELQN